MTNSSVQPSNQSIFIQGVLLVRLTTVSNSPIIVLFLILGDDCDLDECSMMEINGEMAYVLTPEFPQTPMCLKGNVATYYGFTP